MFIWPHYSCDGNTYQEKILFQSLLSSTRTIMIRVEDDYYIAPCMGEIKENRSCLLLRSHSVLLYICMNPAEDEQKISQT